MINPLKYFKNRKVGLVLGSGGAKGLSHIAVIEYLEAMSIPIDIIVGSSIGSIVGAIYLIGDLKRFEEDTRKFTKKELLSLFDFTLPKSGIVKGRNFMNLLQNYIPKDARIEDLPKPFSIVATDYYTGKQIVFTKGNILEAIRASISIPGVFVPVYHDGKLLIDGGVANPLPIDVAKDMGAGLTIAVNLHPGLPISKSMRSSAKPMKSPGKFFKKRNNRLTEEIKRVEAIQRNDEYSDDINKPDKHESDNKYAAPGILEIIFRTIDILGYVNTLYILDSYKPTVLIEPDLLETGTMDFSDAKNIIIAGYSAATEKRMELLRKVKFWI